MEVTFGWRLVTARWGKREVVICVTPPLLAAAMSAGRARLTWRRPALGILVHDIYSRGVAETGAASGVSARALGAVESTALRLADGVGVIHPGFTSDLLEHLGVDPRKIRHARHGTHIHPPDQAACAAFRRANRWTAYEAVAVQA